MIIGASAEPRAPAEMRDAVEKWARQWDRHADLVWDPRAMCFAVELTLRPDDKRLLAWREGRRDSEPKERVLLHEWRTQDEMRTLPTWMQMRNPRTNEVRAGFVAIDLGQLGTSGLIELLDKGNTATGRGEFDSITDAVRSMARKRRDVQEKVEKQSREWARENAADKRRSLMGIPYLPGADLTTEPTTAQG